MRTNPGYTIGRLGCAFFTVGAMLIGWNTARAQERKPPEPKPAEVCETLFLSSSDGQQDANDIQTALRNLLPRTRIYYVNTSNALSIRGSAEDVATAKKVLAEIDAPRRTYQLTYVIKEGGTERHLTLVVTPGERSELKQGSRVPIVTGGNTEAKMGHTEIQYVDVGLTIRASLTGLGNGLRLQSKIEQTSVAGEKSNAAIQDPVIRQSVLEGQTALTPGTQLTLGLMDMPGGRSAEVSVVAEAVK